MTAVIHWKTLLTVSTGSLLLAAGILVACGSSDDSRPEVPDGDATADGAVEANVSLPMNDAGGDVDAAAQRPPFDAATPVVTCAVTPCIERLVAGDRHYCAIAKDGVVRCWGDPGPLGAVVDAGDPNGGATPIEMPGLKGAVDLQATSDHTCVALGDGGIACVGTDDPQLTTMAGVPAASKLALTDGRSCAVLTTGDLYCFGTSYQWGMTNGVMPLGAEHAVSAAVGPAGGFAIGNLGTLYSWSADKPLLGRPTAFAQDLDAGVVTDVPSALSVVTANGSAIALASDGRLLGWGHNSNGVLGIGSLVGASTVTEIQFPNMSWPGQVSLSTTHACARMTDGSLTCWSATNQKGQLGYEDTSGVYVPTVVTGLKHPIVQVVTGFFSTCVLSDDGSVQCWGDNSMGQLALGTRDGTRRYLPTTVVFP